MVKELLPYLWSKWRYPEAHAHGFCRMGLGIKERARKFSSHWASHLAASKRAQRAWIEGRGECGTFTSIAVLGAGRLFDCALPELTASSSELHLCDADPLVRGSWIRAARRYRSARLVPHIFEFSGRLAGWTGELRRSRQWDETLALLRSLGEDDSFRTPLEEELGRIHPRAIVSLNVLSQIPVMWQDLIGETLSRRFGRGFVTEREAEWLDAYVPSARRLVAEHLRALNGAGARSILLVTDSEYLEAPRDGRGPVVSTPALADIDLERADERRRYLPRYRSRSGESWIWDIVPGETHHKVRAFEFDEE